MSDKDLGKKLVEESQFELFANAYTHATRTNMQIVHWGERPDFICWRDGGKCGVELTQVRRDPESRFADEILEHRPWMGVSEAEAMVYERIGEKEKRRSGLSWAYADDTILVVQLMDCPLTEFSNEMLDAICDACVDSGFSEIWLADHTTIGAYREVQLFCLYPQQLRGMYERKHSDRKPYG